MALLHAQLAAENVQSLDRVRPSQIPPAGDEPRGCRIVQHVL